MEYIGFVFGIFGLMAYLEISGLKKKNNIDGRRSRKGTK